MTPSISPPRADDRSRVYARAAWLTWIGFIVLLTVVAGEKTLQSKNSVVPAYRGASLAWMRSQPIYELQSVHGFLYLPASAVLTVPLALLPQPVHEFAFRWLSIVLLAWSLYRLAKALEPPFGLNTFLILTLCVIPPCVGPARAGQMNILLAATMALAVADAIMQRWWPAALWLGLGFALKPQAIVLAALLIALCPKLRLRGTIAIAAAFALPFLFQSPAYVLDQYQLCVEKLTAAGRPSEVGVRNNDFSGVLGLLGIQFSENVRWALRGVAALLTLLACGLAFRRKPIPHNLVVTIALAAIYLVLFNPRTEGGSYVIAAVPVGVFVAWEILERRSRSTALLITLSMGWALSYVLSQWFWTLAHGIGLSTAATFREGFGPYWFSPTLAIVFLVFVIVRLVSEPDIPLEIPPASGAAAESVS
jgi:alpha-1,2-mannosyltransferase